MVDVTPAEGSEYRAFRVIGEGEMYNAKGEKVMSISHTAIEMFRVFKNSSDWEKFEGKVPTNATVRLLKDWSSVRPVYVYTDEDWETIKRKSIISLGMLCKKRQSYLLVLLYFSRASRTLAI